MNNKNFAYSLNPWIRAIAWAIVIFVFSAGYLWMRRWGSSFESVVYKITFAGLASTGTYLLALSYFLGTLAHFWPKHFSPKLFMRKYYGLLGYYLICIHVIWGIITLTPKYYPSFFENGSPTTEFTTLLITGILALVLFSLVAFSSVPRIAANMSKETWSFAQRIGYGALFVALVHFTLVKYEYWMLVERWPTFPEIMPILSLVKMPPLSLILFIFIVIVFVARACAIRRQV